MTPRAEPAHAEAARAESPRAGVSRAGQWRRHALAFVLYAALAALFLDHGEPLLSKIAGRGNDPFIFVWFLQWWPFALTHGLNPLFTGLQWQPAGVAVDWMTSVPLLALLGWPLTMISPVLTYNVFVLLGPVLAAFAAWLLCLRLTRDPAAALVGGFLFGFSSYETAQVSATLNLSFTVCVPLLLLLAVLRVQGALGRKATLLLGTGLLVGQFLICIEVFALLCVFGTMAWALALAYLPAQRKGLRMLAVDALLAAPLGLLVLSPFLVSMSEHFDYVHLPPNWPYCLTADLTNYIIPGQTNLLGRLLHPLGGTFNGGPQEQDAYLGLPLLLLILFFVREQGARPGPRLVFVMFLLLALASLGPGLWIAGHFTGIILPWFACVHLPLLNDALPTRFALFVSLAVALMAALWLAGAPADERRSRLALAGLACLMLLPAPQPWRAVPVSAFFRPGRVEAVLGAQARLMVLPFAINGPSSYWQAENRFGFSETGGYLGFIPRPMQRFPAAGRLFADQEGPAFLADVTSFCALTHTQYLVVGPGTPLALQAEITRLHWRGRQIDDVIVYDVPGGSMAHG